MGDERENRSTLTPNFSVKEAADRHTRGHTPPGEGERRRTPYTVGDGLSALPQRPRFPGRPRPLAYYSTRIPTIAEPAAGHRRPLCGPSGLWVDTAGSGAEDSHSIDDVLPRSSVLENSDRSRRRCGMIGCVGQIEAVRRSVETHGAVPSEVHAPPPPPPPRSTTTTVHHHHRRIRLIRAGGWAPGFSSWIHHRPVLAGFRSSLLQRLRQVRLLPASAPRPARGHRRPSASCHRHWMRHTRLPSYAQLLRAGLRAGLARPVALAALKLGQDLVRLPTRLSNRGWPRWSRGPPRSPSPILSPKSGYAICHRPHTTSPTSSWKTKSEVSSRK